MCDYSLMGVPNRLAVEGEQLVVHRFRTGSLGLAAPLGSQLPDPPSEQPKSVWERLKSFFNPPEQDSVQAVCIPPGARLVIEDIPASLQRALEVGPIELVTFTQIEAAASYRDAVRFKNGRELRLQELREGQHVWVMDLCGAEASEPSGQAISQV
jgi:hypothetical protein